MMMERLAFRYGAAAFVLLACISIFEGSRFIGEWSIYGRSTGGLGSLLIACRAFYVTRGEKR